jgi:hypothetical protein
MCLQVSENSLLAFPAWPEGWSADFQLHAPAQTTVHGQYQPGVPTQVSTSPALRTQPSSSPADSASAPKILLQIET